MPGHAEIATNEPAGEITLPQAIQLAEERHPELEAVRLELEAAEGRITQAAVRPNPSISVETENFFGKDELEGFDGADYTVQLEQTLEWSGKRGKRIRVAKSESQLTAFDLEAMRLDTRAEVIRRFVSVQGAQERLSLGKESVKLAEDFLKAAMARVQAGKVLPMEEDRARILLAYQRSALDNAKKELETTRVELCSMWGDITPRFERAGGDLQVVASSIPALPEVVARQSKNPDLARWATEVEQRKAMLAQEKAARRPDPTIAGGIRRFGASNNDAFVASLSVPLPLFDRNQGKVRETAALLEKAEYQRRAAEATLTANLVAAYQTLSAAWHWVAALKDEVMPRSKAVFDTVQTGYAQGKFTYLDALDAQRAFFESQAEYLEALISYHKAVAGVERRIGGALPVAEKK